MAQLEELATRFRERLPPHLTDDIRAGVLIGSAVADERAGIEQAVPSLVRWLDAPSLFPPQWRSTVAATLAQARGAVISESSSA